MNFQKTSYEFAERIAHALRANGTTDIAKEATADEIITAAGDYLTTAEQASIKALLPHGNVANIVETLAHNGTPVDRATVGLPGSGPADDKDTLGLLVALVRFHLTILARQ